MNIHRKNLYMWVKVIQVSDVAHGLLVILLIFFFVFDHNAVDPGTKFTKQDFFFFFCASGECIRSPILDIL
jgi:hypothetical protein